MEVRIPQPNITVIIGIFKADDVLAQNFCHTKCKY
jgi:hypothetical protein